MSKSIMVVEDDASIRELYTEIFEGEGFEVIEAKNGLEALEILKNGPSSRMPSLVLTDLMMPKMNGIELIKAIKQDNNLGNVPVVLVTSSRERPSVEFEVDYLPKPFDLDTILQKVHHFCGNSSWTAA